MISILNRVLYLLKMLLLIFSFGLTFYIVLFLNQRLNKDLIESIPVFIPFVILLLIFIINIIFHHQIIQNNFFYNFVCCFVFGLIIYVCCRTLFDPYMIVRIRQGYQMNFSYFSDMIAPLQIMLYGLFISNILFIFSKGKEA